MGKMQAVDIDDADCNRQKRKKFHMSFPVFGLDKARLAIPLVIKGRNDMVESADQILAYILHNTRLCDENEIITPNVTDEAAVRIIALDDIQNKAAGYLKHIVAAAESVFVVERLEVVQIDVGQSEDGLIIESALNLVINGNIAP